ncbi:hypothetical protein [Streptomyces jumonjinensis]|uniref:Uncharacterized protein n=1 Tax=Streptomyces jumonjinensis TaxID=1945 RepID=A0A646KRW8_STRJU|nr:hypothetical protein [Streptomyces jumonjinensis]MQT04818.1 hypothetical protein [Streptomyces jumonjinensis]
MNVYASHPRPGESSLPGAIRDLDTVCREAGLLLAVSPSVDDPKARVELGTVNEETVVQLTGLLRTGMKRAYETVDGLRRALAAHDLETPGLGLIHREIVLGDLTVPTSERLAQLLGAPPQESRSALDLDDWPEAEKVVARLHEAFRSATGITFLDLLFHPECLRCGKTPVISTGPIPLKAARRLLRALEYGGSR